MVNTHTMSRSSRSVLNTFIVGVGDRTGVNAHSTGVLVEGAALDEMVSDEMVSDEMVSDEMVSDEMVSETAAGWGAWVMVTAGAVEQEGSIALVTNRTAHCCRLCDTC